VETSLDLTLRNAWKDLHAFSCFSNLAYQTTRKLSPDIYNEMMTSVLYRLTNLSFKEDPLQETVRTALLAFASTLFLIRQFVDQSYSLLFDHYRNVLFALDESVESALPTSVVLWLAVLLHLRPNAENAVRDRETIWLNKAILRAKTNSWSQACKILRSIMWVDFLHGQSGMQAFEAAVLRLNGQKSWR
jgi:hypothetical protein